MSRSNCKDRHDYVWCKNKLLFMLENIPNWHTTDEREAMLGAINAIERLLMAKSLLSGDPRWKDAIKMIDLEDILNDQSEGD